MVTAAHDRLVRIWGWRMDKATGQPKPGSHLGTLRAIPDNVKYWHFDDQDASLAVQQSMLDRVRQVASRVCFFLPGQRLMR